jgi:V/A-type H+-transporting ATPase subunit A
MSQSRGTVVGINGNMVSVAVEGEVALNEVGYIRAADGDESRSLKSEVIRIRGDRAEVQVFEMTTGIGVGDEVTFTGELLAVELGPGLLARVYDGLQNPLPELAEACGFFLDRGVYINALDRNRK